MTPLYALFENGVPQVDPEITGNYHYLNVAPKGVILICELGRGRAFGEAQKHLESLGAVVLPHVMSGEPVGAKVAGHSAAAAAGVTAQDLPFAALSKLFAHHKWPKLDPLGPQSSTGK